MSLNAIPTVPTPSILETRVKRTGTILMSLVLSVLLQQVNIRKGTSRMVCIIFVVKLHVQRTQVMGLPMLAGIRQQLNRMEAESKSKTSDDKYLAKIIGQEIQRAMMAVNEGVTVKAVIDSLMER